MTTYDSNGPDVTTAVPFHDLLTATIDTLQNADGYAAFVDMEMFGLLFNAQTLDTLADAWSGIGDVCGDGGLYLPTIRQIADSLA